jgi:hypothetical protein
VTSKECGHSSAIALFTCAAQGQWFESRAQVQHCHKHVIISSVNQQPLVQNSLAECLFSTGSGFALAMNLRVSGMEWNPRAWRPSFKPELHSRDRLSLNLSVKHGDWQWGGWVLRSRRGPGIETCLVKEGLLAQWHQNKHSNWNGHWHWLPVRGLERSIQTRLADCKLQNENTWKVTPNKEENKNSVMDQGALFASSVALLCFVPHCQGLCAGRCLGRSFALHCRLEQDACASKAF